MRRGKILASLALAGLLGTATAGSSLAQSAASPPASPPPTGSSTATIAAALGSSPASATATLNASAGGVVIAGNVGISFPPGSFGGATGNVTVTVTATPPGLSSINAGGPSQFSPNGTILSITITDSTGAPVTVFPSTVTLVMKPNAADLAMANGDFSRLTMAYVIDSDSPAGENPNHYPINTMVIVAPSNVTVDQTTGVITGNLNFIGSLLGVVTNPTGWVQTLNANAAEYSSFDPATSQVFTTLPQFTYLQVVEPQIGTRLMVLDPKTNNFAYVNASDVGPSGPPPASGSVAGILSNG